MKGFVKNKKSDWAYAMKRSIRPGGEVPLDELYEQYGIKHSIKPGAPFIEWLKNVKLRNKDEWEIVYDYEETEEETKASTTTPVLTSTNVETDDEEFTPKSVIKNMSVDEVALLSVRKAREVLPRVMDLKLLQYALAEAKQLQDKDSLCRLLERRIKELRLAR